MLICFSYYYSEETTLSDEYYGCNVSGWSDNNSEYSMSSVYQGITGFGVVFSVAHILVALSHCSHHMKCCAKFLTCVLHICTYPFLIAATIAYYGEDWGQECLNVY